MKHTPWGFFRNAKPQKPEGVQPGVQDYYNRKGLFSDKGEKKKAFYILKQWYETK